MRNGLLHTTGFEITNVVPQHTHTQNGVQWSSSSCEWSWPVVVSIDSNSHVLPSLHGVIAMMRIRTDNMVAIVFKIDTKVMLFLLRCHELYCTEWV